MPTTSVYEQIVEKTPEDLDQQVLRLIMAGDEEHRVTRVELVYKIFGVRLTSAELQNNRYDRQIRRAIANLQRQGFPIFSDSGKPGYYPGNAQQKEVVIGELIRRRNALDEKIKFLRSANLNAYDRNVKATQPPLL